MFRDAAWSRRSLPRFADMPSVRVGEEVKRAGALVLGVRDRQPAGEYLQAVLVHPGITGELWSTGEDYFMPSVAQAFGELDRVTLAGYLTEARDVTRDLFGEAPPASCLLARNEDLGPTHPSPAGVILNAFPATGPDGVHQKATAAVAALSAAKTWWGGGCRIVGPIGIELEITMHVLALLGVLERQYPSSPVERMARQMSAAGQDDSEATPAGEYNGFDQRIPGTVAADFWIALRGSNTARQELRTLTAQSWGRNVPQETVIAMLERHGVRMP